MFGQRLRLARKRAGFSMRELADRVTPRITPQAISKYEADKMMPSSSVLVGLGKALGVSLDFLMGGQVEQIEGLEFRKHSGTSARDRAKAEAIVFDRLEHYLAVEDILGIEPEDDQFARLRCDHIGSEDAIDAKADAVRNAWDLGNDPISSMCALLEDKGIKVIEDGDLPVSVNGLGCRVPRGGRPAAEVIVVSSRINVERKRSTLAHELAHRIIHSTGNPAIKLEPAMTRFAGAFLVPGNHLIREAGEHRHRIAYDEIMRLKRTYGVSAAAMLVRLESGWRTAVRRLVRYAFGTLCLVPAEKPLSFRIDPRQSTGYARSREAIPIRTPRLAGSRRKADLDNPGGGIPATAHAR